MRRSIRILNTAKSGRRVIYSTHGTGDEMEGLKMSRAHVCDTIHLHVSYMFFDFISLQYNSVTQDISHFVRSTLFHLLVNIHFCIQAGNLTKYETCKVHSVCN